VTVLQAASLVLVALGSVAVVATRNLVRLTFVVAFYAFFLVALFVIFQAPDVALSELVVGVIAYPLVLVVALCKERDR
jgi:energy-converting hydrogenase B subunit D